MRDWLRDHLLEDAKNSIWYIIVLATVVLGLSITVYLFTHGLWWVLLIGVAILLWIAEKERYE